MAQLLYIFLCGLLFSVPKGTEHKKNSILPAPFFSNRDTGCHGNAKRQKELQSLVFKAFVLIGKKKREWVKEGTRANTF